MSRARSDSHGSRSLPVIICPIKCRGGFDGDINSLGVAGVIAGDFNGRAVVGGGEGGILDDGRVLAELGRGRGYRERHPVVPVGINTQLHLNLGSGISRSVIKKGLVDGVAAEVGVTGIVGSGGSQGLAADETGPVGRGTLQ
ncbi:MAG: hypothetical protein AAB768_00100, partial [Patescibacteria group bacterium]